MAEIIAHIGNAWEAKGTLEYTKKLAKDAFSSGADYVSFDIFDELYRDESMQSQASRFSMSPWWLESLYDELLGSGLEDRIIVAPYTADLVEATLDVANSWLIPSHSIKVRPLLDAIRTTNQRVFLETCHVLPQEIADTLTGIEKERVVVLHTAAGREEKDLVLNRVADLWGDLYPIRSAIGFSVLNYTGVSVIASAVLYNAEFIKVNFDSGKGVDSHRSLNMEGMSLLRELVDAIEAARDCGCHFPAPDADYRRRMMRGEDGLIPARQG